MKKYLLSIITLLFLFPFLASGGMVSDSAAALFNVGAYDEAIALWKKESITYMEAGVFFNMALAYVKLGDRVESIYCFEQAHRIAPLNTTIVDQLSKLREEGKEAIIPAQPFFLSTWYKGILALLRPGAWAFLGLGFLSIVVTHVLAVNGVIRMKYVLRGQLPTLVLSLSLVCMGLAFLSFQQLARQDEAITIQRCDIRQGATIESPALRELEAGEKLNLEDRIGDWYYVTLANLDKGWIRRECIRVIQLPGI